MRGNYFSVGSSDGNQNKPVSISSGVNDSGSGRRLFVRIFFSLGVLLAFAATTRADITNDNCLFATLTNGAGFAGRIVFTTDCDMAFTSVIEVKTNLVIDATGHTVRFNGSNARQLFRVVSNSTLTVVNVTMINGSNTNGGALFVDSGSSALLTNCIFISNRATGTNGATGSNGVNHADNGGSGLVGSAGQSAAGGAIYSKGTLSAFMCRFSTNTAQGGNGGKGGNGGAGDFTGGNGANGGLAGSALGGAIYSTGSVTLMDCTFENNSATGGAGGSGGAGGASAFPGLPGDGKAGGEGSGGAIYSTFRLSVDATTFSSNRARSGNSAAAGADSTDNGNNGTRGTDSLGGAICSMGNSALTNSTFFSNTTSGGNGGNGGPGAFTGGDGGDGGHAIGGGIYNSGTAYLLHCTLAQCNAFGGTNGFGGASAFPGNNGSNGGNRGGNAANAGSFTNNNSILASASSGGNGYGTFTFTGTNISSDNSISSSASLLKNTDPKLGTLADNGGPTKTMSLNSGSPAIDAIAACAIAVDQRGTNRTSPCDIGAFEGISFSIQGKIRRGTNGLGGIQINVNNSFAISDTNGNYVVQSLLNGIYTNTPQPVGLFIPTNIAVTIASMSVSNVDFAAVESRATAVADDSNRNLKITFFTFPSHTQLIQASTNLSAKPIIWQTISTNTASSSGLIQFTDSNYFTFPKRFFRTMLR